jgi:hypothetical protein
LASADGGIDIDELCRVLRVRRELVTDNLRTLIDNHCITVIGTRLTTTQH